MSSERPTLIECAHWDGDDLLLRVKVQPKASRNALGELLGDRLKVYLTAPPVDGKANSALIKQLAKEFKVAKGQITIQRGELGREKELRIEQPTRIPAALQS